MPPAFPQSARSHPPGLRTRDFDRVYRDPARRLRSQHFAVVARRNPWGRTRWGVSVKAQLGNAVLRNRVKRRLREILSRCLEQLPAGWDVVVQPRTGWVATGEFAALTRELERLLEKALAPGEKG